MQSIRCTGRLGHELYTDFEGFGTELSDGEIREVAEVGAAYAEVDDYHDRRCQVDPLQHPRHRTARAAAVDSMRPLSLAEEYVAHRSFTREFLETAHANEAAGLRAAKKAARRGVRILSRIASSAS